MNNSDRKGCLNMVSNDFAWRFSSIVYFKDFSHIFLTFPSAAATGRAPKNLFQCCDIHTQWLWKNPAALISGSTISTSLYTKYSVIVELLQPAVSARIFLLDDGARLISSYIAHGIVSIVASSILNSFRLDVALFFGTYVKSWWLSRCLNAASSLEPLFLPK